jgi:hypothetical protein
MAKRKDATIFWYVEPIGTDTHEHLPKMLHAESGGQWQMCSDGKPHCLWPASRDEVVLVLSNRRTHGLLRFFVWYQGWTRKRHQALVARLSHLCPGRKS